MARIDIDAAYRRVMARFPHIMAALHKSEQREVDVPTQAQIDAVQRAIYEKAGPNLKLTTIAKGW